MNFIFWLTTIAGLPGFNRYMVECESFSYRILFNPCAVLIDTWWNVNYLAVFLAVPVVGVLIDTWWNVNQLLEGAVQFFTAF